MEEEEWFFLDLIIIQANSWLNRKAFISSLRACLCIFCGKESLCLVQVQLTIVGAIFLKRGLMNLSLLSLSTWLLSEDKYSWNLKPGRPRSSPEWWRDLCQSPDWETYLHGLASILWGSPCYQTWAGEAVAPAHRRWHSGTSTAPLQGEQRVATFQRGQNLYLQRSG